jgi:hypothetical protein
MSTFNAGTNTGSSSFLLGSGVGPQILLAIVSGLVLFIIFYSIESLVQTFNRYKTAKTLLVPNTIMSNRAIVVRQDPSDPNAKMILPSDNERTGVEFTYTFFLFIDPATFNNADTDTILKTVFYKGYSKPFPLIGPGVFVMTKENTMRISMNSYKTWFNYVDIKNVPIQKWFHVAILFRANNLEVYVNGNMKGRISMEDTYPYQNYQNVNIFSSAIFSTNDLNANGFCPNGKSCTTSSDREKFSVSGAMIGQISRLSHYRYALSFSEIQAAVNEGPSSQIDTSGDLSASSYLQNTLADSWYTS